MEILNIGPLELIIILILMFVVLGPKDMILTAQRIGQWIRKFVRSPMWREIWGYSQEIRELPQKIMEESGLEETLAEVRQSTQAAADELHNQIKEVTDATRVPEIEHLRIDPGAAVVGSQVISPPAANKVPEATPTEALAVPADPALLKTETAPVGAPTEDYHPSSDEVASSETAAVISTGLETAPAEDTILPVPDAAVLSVAEGLTTSPEAVVVKKTRRRKTQEAESSAEEPAQPKPRRRKSSSAVDEVSSAVAQEMPPETAVVKDALPPEENTQSGLENVPVVVSPSKEEIPQPKPRRRKKAAVEEILNVETAETNAVAAQPAEPAAAEIMAVDVSEPGVPVVRESAPDELMAEPLSSELVPSDQPVATNENSASLIVAEPTPETAAVTRRPRKPRTPRLKQPADEVLVTDEPLNGGNNGTEHSESHSVKEEEPQKSDAA